MLIYAIIFHSFCTNERLRMSTCMKERETIIIQTSVSSQNRSLTIRDSNVLNASQIDYVTKSLVEAKDDYIVKYVCKIASWSLGNPEQ